MSVGRAILAVAVVTGCAAPAPAPASPPADPLARAVALRGRIDNREAGVPPMCYTHTGGVSNPCWVCHSTSVGRNSLNDADLQLAYAFSETALVNHWTNLFVDRRPFIASISDDAILAYVRQDNYAPLRAALADRAGYRGYRPDLDLGRGFDELGFARDGSGWRAVRFQPFPGAFWPSNGSTDDVFVRLPPAFRADGDGRSSREVYRLNLSILEAAIAGSVDGTPRVDRAVEPIDERLAHDDLDGDGAVAAATRIRALPAHYAGAARDVPVVPHAYPAGTELLHSVRYLDPDAPTRMATRMKELRYMRKVVDTGDAWAPLRAYEREADEKSEGRLPAYAGDALEGMLNAFGWQLQAFIEDEAGALRLQTDEEHRFCMGCHSLVGTTIDQTFSFARKVPGLDGWRPQDLRGLRDRPEVGQPDPEVLTYFRRVGGGDETRSNDELLARYFPGGVLDEAAVRRAAVGGDRDLFDLLAPSRDRALALDKAYLAIVREQSFRLGRDAVLHPATRVHRRVVNGSTELATTGSVFRDGRLHLVWEPGPSEE